MSWRDRPTMTRLLLVTTGLGLGGAETQVVDLSKRLIERGWELRVVSMTPPGALVEELERAGIPVVSLGMRRRAPNLRAAARLVRLVRSWQPHVVHAHMFHANILARLVRPLAPVPVLVCTAHSTYEVPTSTGKLREITWRERAYRWTDWLCDLTTQISQVGLERYVRVRAVPRHKIRIVPNGVDTARFRPGQDKRRMMRERLGLEAPFVWVAVGRIEVAKDYPTMLRAFAAVSREGNESALLIVGEGSLKKEAQRLAGDLGLGARVRFLGARGDVEEIMNAGDGFVLSSAWEGFGIALAEAMACGLPVVATDSGGPREILDEARVGFLVPPRDPAGLAQAMLRVMRLPTEECGRLGEVARQHVVANYSLDRVVAKWEALYRELLARKGVHVE